MSDAANGPHDGQPSSIPKILPILASDEVVLFPHMVAPLTVTRRADAAAMDEALVRYRFLGVLAVREDVASEDAETRELYSTGAVCQVLKMLKMPDDTRRIVVQGISRMRVTRWVQRRPYLLAEIEALDPEEPHDLEMDALVRTIRNQFEHVVELTPQLPGEAVIQAANIDGGGKLADFVVSNVPVDRTRRQRILETEDVKKRLIELTSILSAEIQVLELEQKIQSETRSEMDKAQRDYVLRQQLEQIRKELGDEDDAEIAVRELEKAIAESGMPEDARAQADRELKRLARMPTAAAEYTVSRTYLDWLVKLPWASVTEDVLDVKRAAQILDEDHYGLEKVKDRILEYLAVLQLNPDMKGPILCFVGPPGVGKTSLGRSIARALGRKFVRMSLGGMRDEAEIRGHRRTYIGALPGRIVQSIANAATRNPVFMLDEIDKVGADFRGDPSSALLEVLDPEQNNTFRDHYLDVDFDLSRVMFITTANVLDTVPRALLDRMEVLRLPGYTLEEKLQIARRYLVPRQIREHGLATKTLRIPKATLASLISGYTRESGLRNLEREIATLCRKRARKLAEGENGAVSLRPGDLPEFLGPPRFHNDIVERTAMPGVAAGLAWTSTGGEVLFIECAAVPGSGRLTLTGQLGDVMQESARAALTCVRRQCRELGIDPALFSRVDLHVHVPAGQVPKDGPSAGITLATAIASCMTERLVRHDLAMTGEITLQGKILPIGGVKEKSLAAARSRVKTVLLPSRNEADLSEIPPEILEKVKFVCVDHLRQVLDLALLPAKRKRGLLKELEAVPAPSPPPPPAD